MRYQSETVQGAGLLALAVILFGIVAGAFRALDLRTLAYLAAAIGAVLFGNGIRNAIAKNGSGR